MNTPQQTIGQPRATLKDAGNGSKAICRASNVFRSPLASYVTGQTIEINGGWRG